MKRAALLLGLAGCRITFTAQDRDNLHAYGAASTDGAICAAGSYLITTWDPLAPKPAAAPVDGGHP